jgi:hypothetical protein
MLIVSSILVWAILTDHEWVAILATFVFSAMVIFDEDW